MDLVCPNCDTHLEVNLKNECQRTPCPKCLANFGKRFIMLENDSTKYKNMGGGFFEKEIDK